MSFAPHFRSKNKSMENGERWQKHQRKCGENIDRKRKHARASYGWNYNVLRAHILRWHLACTNGSHSRRLRGCSVKCECWISFSLCTRKLPRISYANKNNGHTVMTTWNVRIPSATNLIPARFFRGAAKNYLKQNQYRNAHLRLDEDCVCDAASEFLQMPMRSMQDLTQLSSRMDHKIFSVNPNYVSAIKKTKSYTNNDVLNGRPLWPEKASWNIAIK